MAVDIQKLIDKKNIETVMQLVISPNQDYAAGIEALSRGIDPDTGERVSPMEMINAADHSGLLPDLEKLMLYKALETFKPLHEANPDLLLFMNMGTRFIEICQNTDYIDSAIQAFDIPVSNIFFDITAFESNRLVITKNFADIYRGKGFYMCIDDIGSDYNNIDKLLYLSPDIVKIDFRALRKLENKTYAENMIKTLKFITETLGIIMVAKGIEDEEDVSFALANGAQFMQGYYISQPLDLTTESLISIKDRYRNLMAAHVIEEGSRTELSRQMTSKAYMIMNSIKEMLSRYKDNMEAVDAESIYSAFPMVENFWILDDTGIQNGTNHVNLENYMPKKTSMFQIYSPGTDFSGKEIFSQLYNTILNVWVTPPFNSILTNNLCVGSSIRLDFSPEMAVFCANINLSKIHDKGKSPEAIENEEEGFKIIIGD